MCGINATSGNAAIVSRHGTTVLLSWEGFRRLHHRRHVTDDDVQAFALLLEKRGLKDQAEELLERYIAGYKVL